MNVIDMACINPNDPRFKEILARVNNPLLAELEMESPSNEVRYMLKSVAALLSDRAVSLFASLQKNRVAGDQFWNKVQQDLGIPKDQIKLLKQYDTTDREQLIVNMVSDYSYTIEINIPEQAVDEIQLDVQQTIYAPTNYYSNLTVPGGTNYTESEIATPGIVPAIQGHAQFATKNGIGWFRSDDKSKEIFTKDSIPVDVFTIPHYEDGSLVTYYKKNNKWYIEDKLNTDREVSSEFIAEIYSKRFDKSNETPTKTRRVLEIQSDLFQKGRGIKYLTDDSRDLDEEIFKNDVTDKTAKEKNQFLQLLNKENNWATFFTKSIIQDSVKKGYEKVLFPKGDTASKVEGHQTLEEFKRQKEARIKELEKRTNNLEVIKKGWFYKIQDGNIITNENYNTEEEANKALSDRLSQMSNEINQLKQELERVEREGFAALKPIYNFYENTVGNILKKQGYAPTVITDEYGNQWYEVDLSREMAKQPILFQLSGKTVLPKASAKTIKIVKDLLDRIGVGYETVNGIVINGVKMDANAVANITQQLVQVVEGKEDVALVEEAMHFAIEIIQRTDPKLFNQMMSEINNYKILKETFAEYSSNPYYQTKDGKPDVIKIKKEAMGKLLGKVIIEKSRDISEVPGLIAKIQALWTKLVEKLKSIFLGSGFNTAAIKILSGEDIGTAADIKEVDDLIYLQRSSQQAVYNKLKEVRAQIEKREDGYYINGKKIPKRVTDFVDDWYERRFRANELTKSEWQRSVDDLKKEKGTAGHSDIEYAFKLFVDDEGYLRDTPLDDSNYVSQLDNNDRKYYEALRDNLKERLNSFKQNTRFLSEAIVYDAKRGIAGTIDFLAIEDTGKVNILDWKFMNLNVEKYEMEGKRPDVPWYKVGAWKQQMEQYRLILEKAYGVDPGDFGQTRMIPILASYTQGDPKKKILPRLSGVKIGNVNVQLIDEDYLIPVGLESESTGNKKIDALIEKLNAVYKKLSEKKVLPTEKMEKAEQLNALFTAIRQLQMKQNIKPLIYQAKVINTRLRKIIDIYNSSWKGVDPRSVTQEKISAFYDDIEDAQNAISYYTTLDTELKFLFQKDLSEDDKKLREDLRETVDEARDLQSDLFELGNEFVTDFVAGSEGVDEYFKPEKVVKGISKWFSTTSTIQLRAMEVLFKKANRAYGLAAMDTVTETKKLQQLKRAYDTWAASKGLTNKTYFDMIMKKDKNELIDEFNRDFYTKLKEAISEKDYKWIRENIDVESYKETLRKQLEEEEQRIRDRVRPETGEEYEKAVKREIRDKKELYNISTPTSPGWLLYDLVKKHPNRETWESSNWKELHKSENKPALDFYNYIKERNEYYASIGYINAAEARVFLPFVRKGLMEKLIMGGKITFGEQFLRSISIDEGDIGFGKIDPLTGRPIDTVPIYLTRDIEGEVSKDLFRTMALYNELAIKYKYVSDIEAQGRALINTERNKKAIATSTFGKTVYKNGVLQFTPDNNENTNLVESMVKAIIYQQRYIESESFDQLLGSLGNFGERANKLLGMNIFPENLSGRQMSINKIVNQLNTTFQLNALGLNPFSALSNLLGGSFQSTINAETYFTRVDFAKAQMLLTASKFNVDNKKQLVGALEYFLPLTENYNKEIAKTLSLNKFSQENVQEFLMILMRSSDQFVQTANFYAYLNNTIVDGDRVINVREYLRQQPEFADMYLGTSDQISERKNKFESEVKRLLEEKAVLKLAKIENNELVIPGVDRKSESVIALRRRVQGITKDALGNLSEDDLRLINLNIMGKSFMILKNWIPRLVDVRMGNIKYNAASDAYEWGRLRNVFRIISEDVFSSLSNLYNSLQGNEKGVEFIRELYEKKKRDYKEDTGKTLKMTQSEFIDLVRKNIRAQLVDAIFMLTLLGLYLAAKANAPDDDEDEVVKNQYKLMLKLLDKVKDELAYFYDFTSYTSLVSSGIFPSVSYINNFKKILVNFMKEMYAIGIGDEETRKKNYVLKYVMKTFPITNQLSGMLPAFYPELAKDLGIRAQSQARPTNL